MKTVYTCFTTDTIHDGHLNILREAKKYGKVIVGVMIDEAKVRFDKFPAIPFDKRFEMIKNLDLVDEVVVQDDISYEKIITSLKPDYIIHGDNWKKYPQSAIRENVISLLKKHGGELIEVPYTQSATVEKADSIATDRLAMPEFRRKRLRLLLSLRPIVKAMEAHNGISGLIVEKTTVERDGELDQFDAMWVSSLCDSTTRGKPDIELVDISSRIRTLEEIMEVTTKPIIYDGDTGGQTEHFKYNVKTLERMGISAVIIEDKMGLKRNSLFGTEVEQTQAPVDEFCEKIAAGKDALRTEDFMIIARIESLILDVGVEDALKRAFAYVEAGADGIMIHSRKREPDEVFEFCDRFREKDKDTPIVVVPTTFNAVTEDEFQLHGINIVIYANQLTRSAFPAMKNVAETILQNKRSKEVDADIMPIKEIIELIGIS